MCDKLMIRNYPSSYEPEDALEWGLVLDEIKGFIKADAAVSVLHADSNPIVLSHRYAVLCMHFSTLFRLFFSLSSSFYYFYCVCVVLLLSSKRILLSARKMRRICAYIFSQIISCFCTYPSKFSSLLFF